MTDEELTEYLGQLTHSLRTPLATVRGLTELMIRGADRISADKRADYLDRISEAGTRLEQLIRDVETRKP